MAATARIEVLGPVRALADGSEVVPRGITGRTVAACLALGAGRTVSVDNLVEALWGDDPPPSAGNTVQSAVSRLRSALGRDAVVRGGDGYRIDLAVVSTDVADLERLSGAAARASDPAESAALLDEALGMWRGEALADVAATTLMLPERARLGELRASLRDRRHFALLDVVGGAEIVADLSADAARWPLRETTQLLLMRALADSGRIAEALRAAAAYRRRLADETGLSPSPAFVAAEQGLIFESQSGEGSSSLVDAAPSAAVGAPDADAEEARSSDLRAPVGGPDDGDSTDAPIQLRRWAPPDNEFVGRDDEFDSIRRLLGGRRLLTIVGPGGVGKTRLAMELVRNAAADLPEVVVVELASVERDREILPALAGELGLTNTGGDLVAAITERLELFAGLLVLDNCEHVRSQARELVEQVLRRAPSVRILATSRRRLGLPDEHVMWLDPLPSPRVDADEPTVRLFLDRMERVGAGDIDADALAAVAEICRAVEGIPLAIELAASRVALLGLDELRTRLSASLEVLSLPGPGVRRQATLDATIDWSLDLLDPPVRSVLEQLSVFPDRFELAHAEAVVAGDLLPALAELVDSSLVTVDRAGPVSRYGLLAPIREHARRRLDAAGGSASALDAHAAWVLDLVAAFESAWTGTEPLLPPTELRQYRADVVGAMRHLTESGRGDDMDRLARHIALGLLEYPDIGFSSIIPTVTGASVDAAVARAVIGVAVGRPRPDELDDLESAFASLGEDDPRRHLLLFAFVPAHLYRGDTDSAMAACRAMLADERTPTRLRVLAVSMWALAEGLLGRYEVGQSILDDHHEVLGLADVGGFVSYVRAEVAAGTDTDRALALLDEAMAEASDARLGFVSAAAGVLQLSLLVHSGAHDAAVDLARRMVPALLTAGTIPQVWRVFRSLGHVLVARDHHATAARALACADADPRAPIVLGPWTETIGRLWKPITDAIGPDAVEAIRAEAPSISLRELWTEVDAALGAAPGER